MDNRLFRSGTYNTWEMLCPTNHCFEGNGSISFGQASTWTWQRLGTQQPLSDCWRQLQNTKLYLKCLPIMITLTKVNDLHSMSSRPHPNFACNKHLTLCTNVLLIISALTFNYSVFGGVFWCKFMPNSNMHIFWYSASQYYFQVKNSAITIVVKELYS